MDLSELVIKLTLDKDEAEQDAEEASSGIGEKIKKGLGTAGKVAAGAVTTVAAAGAALTKVVIDGASQTAEYGDNIDKMSQKLGMSAEAYQEWDAILRHSGTSIESMQSSMKTLQVAAENGSEAFEQLGLSQEEIAKMSPEELFSATITALQNVESETERTYLATKLLGRGGMELGALLNTSAEETEAMRQRVHELGGIMSDEAVKAAAAYTDSLQDMKTAFSGLQRGLFEEFMPALTTVMDGLTEIFSGNGEAGIGLISEGVSQLVDRISEKVPEFLEVSVQIVSSIAEAIINNLPMLAESATQIVLQLVTSIIESLPNLLDAAGQILMTLVDGITEAIPTLIPAIVEVVLAIVEKLSDPGTLSGLIGAAAAIISALIDGLTEAIPQIVEAMPEIVSNIVTGLTQAAPQLLTAGVELMVQLIAGLIEAIPQIVEAIPEIITGMVTAFQESWPQIKETGVELLNTMWEGIQSVIPTIVEGVKQIWEDIKTAAVDAWTNIKTEAENKWNDIKSSVTGKIDDLKSGIRERFDGIKKTISDKIELIKGLFNFNWSFPSLKLPHITYTLIHVPILGDIPDPRTLKVEWYRKAYENPYMFTQPTVVGNLGFGDGNGGEIVYGHQNLLNDIKTAMTDVFGGQDVTIVVQSVLDGKVIGESVTKYQRQQARAFG